MSISTNVASDKPSKLLELYLWVKLTNPGSTITLVYILKQLKLAIIAAEKYKLKDNFYERFIKQEEEYDLIIDEQMKREIEELELKKAKDKQDDALLLMVHTMFEDACKKLDDVIYVNPVPIYENMNAQELKSSIGYAPEKVDKMPEFKVLSESFSKAQEKFMAKIEDLNGEKWREKMQPVINQLKDNMDKILAGTFLKPTAKTNTINPSAEVPLTALASNGAQNENTNPLFINSLSRKDMVGTLQYLEEQYKQKLALSGKADVENQATKLGKILEGHYTQDKVKDMEKRLKDEKKVSVDAPIFKSVKNAVKAIESETQSEKDAKKAWVPKPKPEGFSR